MKLKIGETLYEIKHAEELSLFDLLNLERETRALGRPLTMSVIQGMQKSVQAAGEGLPKAEADKAKEEHPDGQWLLALTIWAARRGAGEAVTFQQATSFPLSDLDFISEPGDEVEDESVPPTPARTGSVRAARPGPKQPSTNRSKKR